MKNKHKHLLTIFYLIILCIISLVGTSRKRDPELNAEILYEHKQEFIFTNNDNFDWTNVTISVNYHYITTLKKIEMEERCIVKFDQFKNAEGDIFYESIKLLI
jgi:hypothetical protein